MKPKITELKAKIALKKAEIDVLNNEITALEIEVNTLKWKKMSWIELEELLIKLNNKENYERNPIVRSAYDFKQCLKGYDTYCFIVEKQCSDGQLQIGPYYNNDRFPRYKKEDVYVNLNERWR